ncbi:P-loop containing nucleoside triphosphate hydrolase protein, partial [Mycena crocata]
SEVATSDISSINRVLSSSNNSSNSFSLLPSEPKIFHGRDSELADILQHFTAGSPRIAILGLGGMGKTSLARAVLHHPQITAKYEAQRIFVPCESVSSKTELVAAIGSHLGLKPSKDLARSVIQYLSTNPAILLILDNLETPWEPKQTRTEIEEFLSLVTDVQHLALIITMRGAERPAKVRWTHPFLSPLSPLGPDAARQVFVDIADEHHDSDAIDNVLKLTDNMPLAIDLIANLVDLEGCSNVLSRWEDEKTSLISEGYDRRSNLDLSISVSLASPRMISSPQSQVL